MTTQNLTIRFPAPFPSTVAGDGGIAVSKENGVWIIEPDFSALGEILPAALADPSAKQIWVFDPVAETYNVLTLGGLGEALYKATSTTSFAIGAGSKTFVTQSGKDFAVGSFVLAASDADPTNHMFGRVTAYSGTSLTINVTATGGSGTKADWTIRVSGPMGATGAPGTFGGSAGTDDNGIPRADGVGGTTLQNSLLAIDDSGNIHPKAHDTGALGTAAKAFADLFLATGAVVNFGNGDVTVTHSADQLTLAGGKLHLNVSGLSGGEHFLIEAEGTTWTDQHIVYYGDGLTPALHFRHARGTKASPSQLLSGDVVGAIGFRSYHSGGGFQASSGSAIYSLADENQTGSAQGQHLELMATPPGSTTKATALYAYGSRGISVGAAADPGAGVINANTGFRVANGATLGNVLRANGTNFISAALAMDDVNDYDTGTWTPVLTFVTPGNLSVAYSVQSGVYTKIGDTVFYEFNIITSAFTHTTAAGDVQVTGAPFAAGTATFINSLRWQGITKAGYTQLYTQSSSSSSTISVRASGSGVAVAAVTAADMPTGGSVQLVGTGFYKV